jgi:hypothetical protein
MPTTPILLIRFPDGDVEYRSIRGEFPIGALIRARGVLWRVMSYRGDAVIVEPADAPLEGAPGSALIIPDALGDMPLKVDRLSED